jgi:hypothetical protein
MLPGLFAASLGRCGFRRRLTVVTSDFSATGAVARIIHLILRWIEAGRAPFSVILESLVLF